MGGARVSSRSGLALLRFLISDQELDWVATHFSQAFGHDSCIEVVSGGLIQTGLKVTCDFLSAVWRKRV